MISLDRFIRTINRWADARPRGFGRILARAVDWPIRAAWHVWRNRRYLTAYKLLNMGVVNVEGKLRRRRLWGLPYIVKIEPTNICNSACQLCPTGRNLPGRDKGKMPLDAFCRIIDQVKRHAYVADLSNWGDPLIHPDIYKMIRYAHDAGLWTYISSNLHAFRPDDGDADAMVRSGLNMLNCSLHAASQAAYEAYQPGKRLDTILGRIQALRDARVRLGSATPVVQLFFVVTRHNEHERADFEALARGLACEPIFIPASLNLRLVPMQDREPVRRQWLPVDEHWVAPWYRGGKPDGGSDGKVPKIYSCGWPWWGTVINWDGDVSVCCGDYDPRCAMGNVLREPLKAIWNNHGYQAARESFVRPIADCAGEPCRSCPGILI